MHLSASAEEAAKAYDQIQKETEYYNEQVARGKWRHMMSSNPRNRPALRKPAPDEKIRPESGTEDAGAAGGDGYICFEAEQPSRSVGGGGTAWKLIQGLGRSGDSIALLPTTVDVPSAAVLEYDFDLAQAVDATVQVYCIPTHPITPDMQLRCSVGIDSGESRIIDLASAEFSSQWSANVLRAATIGSTGKMPIMAGKHILKLRPLNPGVVFDKIVIDLGELKPTHLGPPAIRATP
jgi:hypothetical protein